MLPGATAVPRGTTAEQVDGCSPAEISLIFQHGNLLSHLSFGTCSSQGSTRNTDFHAYVALTKLFVIS